MTRSRSKIKPPAKKSKLAVLKSKPAIAAMIVLGLVGACQGNNMRIEGNREARRENFEDKLRAAYPDAFAPASDLGISVNRVNPKYDSVDEKGKDCCAVSFSRTQMLGTLTGRVYNFGIDRERTQLDTNARGKAIDYNDRDAVQERYTLGVASDVRKAFCLNSAIQYDGVTVTGQDALGSTLNGLSGRYAVQDDFTPSYKCTGGNLQMMLNGNVVAQGRPILPRPIPHR